MLLKVIVYNGVIYKACDNECKNVDCKRLSFVCGVYSVTWFSLLPCLLVYRYGKRWKRQTIHWWIWLLGRNTTSGGSLKRNGSHPSRHWSVINAVVVDLRRKTFISRWAAGLTYMLFFNSWFDQLVVCCRCEIHVYFCHRVYTWYCLLVFPGAAWLLQIWLKHIGLWLRDVFKIQIQIMQAIAASPSVEVSRYRNIIMGTFNNWSSISMVPVD